MINGCSKIIVWLKIQKFVRHWHKHGDTKQINNEYICDPSPQNANKVTQHWFWILVFLFQILSFQVIYDLSHFEYNNPLKKKESECRVLRRHYFERTTYFCILRGLYRFRGEGITFIHTKLSKQYINRIWIIHLKCCTMTWVYPKVPPFLYSTLSHVRLERSAGGWEQRGRKRITEREKDNKRKIW